MPGRRPAACRAAAGASTSAERTRTRSVTPLASGIARARAAAVCPFHQEHPGLRLPDGRARGRPCRRRCRDRPPRRRTPAARPAASRTASVPARWPPEGCSRRSRPSSKVSARIGAAIIRLPWGRVRGRGRHRSGCGGPGPPSPRHHDPAVGNAPMDPSRELTYWSATKHPMPAPSSRLSTTEIRTMSLVRSRMTMAQLRRPALPAQRRGATDGLLRQGGAAWQFAARSGHNPDAPFRGRIVVGVVISLDGKPSAGPSIDPLVELTAMAWAG